MKQILSYMKPHLALSLATVAVKFVSTIVLLLIPFVLGHVVDHVVPTGNFWAVLGWGVVMVLLAVLERSLNLKSSRMSTKVAREGTRTLRADLFARAMDLSGAQADQFGLPSLTARLTADGYNIQNLYQNLLTFAVRAPTLVLGSILLSLLMDPGLALILCILAPVMIAAVAVVSFKGIPLFGDVQKKSDAAIAVLRENITGVRPVRALSKQVHEGRRFEGANQALKASEQKAGDIMSLPGPLATLFLNLGLVGIVLVGARRVDSGLTQPGTILAFLTYFNMILMGVMGLNRVFMILSKANASARRIAAVLEQPEQLPTLAETDAAPAPGEGMVIFDKVSFRYGQGGELCLSDLSFTVKKGGSLGIIGPTGSGKTTLINLLLRFYDPTEGAVYVGGRDVRTYEKDDLRRKFGTVFQNDTIFADSIAENISFGRDLSPEDVRRAAQHAMAAEFIERYEDGYGHVVAAHGADLSGGQKQCLLIARALAARPEILVLDDATSALDYRTDAALRANLAEHYADTTTILVAQRISSLQDCDEILMLDEGGILGRGTHEELLRTCPRYRDIYEAQMGDGKAVG